VKHPGELSFAEVLFGPEHDSTAAAHSVLAAAIYDKTDRDSLPNPVGRSNLTGQFELL
jgi:hypothetical protein